MRAVSIIGFKNSGKSSLAGFLAGALERRGLRTAVAKHSHSGLDKPDTDSGRLRAPGRAVLALSEDECAVFYGRRRFLMDVLPLISEETDILLVEGGKNLGFLPRILCLRAPAEQEPGEWEKLDPSLAIAAWSRTGELPAQAGEQGWVPWFFGEAGGDDAQLDRLADLVWERAFLLPGLDCGACGLAGCRELAASIAAGRAGTEYCTALHADLELAINGQALGVNPFTARIIAGALRGMLRELKGYAPGELNLKMKA